MGDESTKSSGTMQIPRLCERTREGPIYCQPNVGCPASEANRERAQVINHSRYGQTTWSSPRRQFSDEFTRDSFSHQGIPDELITGNGPQFKSHEYSRFAREYGFTTVKSSPYYCRGNGKVESAVKIAKNILKKSRKEDLYLALLAYRNTLQQGYNYYPAQCLMSRRLRYHPYSTPSTHPTDGILKSCAWRHRRKKTKIDGSV